MNLKIRHAAILFQIITLIFFSCRSTPARTVVSAGQTENNEARQLSGGLADEIRGLIETGRLSSMGEALELIRARNLGGVDFGRIMNGIITVLVKNIYPDSMIQLPALDLPQTYNYTRIIREAERGIFLNPSGQSTDFFEYILPFLAVNNNSPPSVLADALKNSFIAGELRPSSVLPLYFRALVYEYTGWYEEAEAAFRAAHEIYDDFYPALTGIARVMKFSGRNEEAAELFSDLVVSFPDSLNIKRQLAITQYENRAWSRALPIIDEILLEEPRDGDFLLMKAHILIEQGNFSQAASPLDTYASINTNNRFYLFLRARLQAEGNRNRDSALNYLRSIIRSNPDDEEALIYASRLLLESQRTADQTEGREFLERLRRLSPSSVTVLNLSLRDAVHRESWQEAQGFLNRILADSRTAQDLTDAYYIEQGLGNNARAFAYARELYDRDTSNNDYITIYISALIDNDRRDEASRMLENRLSAPGTGTVKSRFYFQRSRIQNNDEMSLVDLRSSIFEDPRNLDALIAMFEIYRRRREERRAVYYLRQALVIAPDNPRLKRYESEYSAILQRD